MQSPAIDAVMAGPVERERSVRWVLASLALCTLLPSLGTSIANVALPTLAGAFGASFQQVQWVVLAYLLATTSLIVSAGRLGDVVGRRRLLIAGTALFTVASAACGIASELWVLVAARAVQGMGAAMMLALTMAFVGGALPKEKSGSAMGLLGTMSAVGTALGPTLGGALIASAGWPAIFLVNVPLGLVAMALIARSLPADREKKGVNVQFDLTGTVLLAMTLAAYALAMTLGRGSFGVLNLVLLLAGVVGIGLFVAVENKVPSPLVRLGLFRDPALSAGFAMSALVTSVVMATLVVGPFYLSSALGLDAARVGLVMSCGPIVAALAGVPAGRAVDRFGARRVTLAGLAAAVLGCIAMSAAAGVAGVAAYAVPLVVITAGYAVFQAANNTAVMSDVPANQRGVISGLLNLSRNLGLITGASAMGAVFAMAAGPDASIESISTGFRVTFAVAAVAVAAALAIATRVGSRPR